MKTIKFTTLILITFLLLVTNACKKEKSVSDSLLVGTWTTTNSLLSITVDGVSFVDYLVSELEYTQEDAEEFLKLFQNTAPSKITFDENWTYIAYFLDDVPESGSWRLSDDEKTLIITPQDDDDMVIEITNLTSSSLDVIASSEETDDLNEDGNNELLIFTLTMSFTR